VRFHDLRHTHAALLIAQGVHPKAIQERLGHSSIRVTLDRYGHLLPAIETDLVRGLDATLLESRVASQWYSDVGDPSAATATAPEWSPDPELSLERTTVCDVKT